MNGELSIFDPKFDAKLKKISETFSKFGDKFKITEQESCGPWTILKLKLLEDTQEAHIRAHISDVQIRLKFKQMILTKKEQTLYLVVTDDEIEYPHLPEILANPNHLATLEQQELPLIAGFGIPNTITVYDLAIGPHMLLGGAPSSGKTVGLQGAITTLAYTKTPAEVNLLLIDTGTTNLKCFNGLPHLACPVVETQAMASRALSALLDEMERRIELEDSDQNKFTVLPRIVLVIDELPSLFSELDKDEMKRMAGNLSSILRRGRHGRIHTVLAAQDPTRREIRVELSNITVKIAYRCDRWQNSATILGTSGAETLSGNGELLMKAPGLDGVQRLQGVFVSSGELRQLIQQIKARQYQPSEYGQKFTIPKDALRTADTGGSGVDTLTPIAPKLSVDDQKFAEVLLWSLSQSFISVNRLMADFQMGWSKASRLVAKLEDLGVVARLDSKLPRHVVPTELGDIPFEMMAFLQRNGISDGDVSRVLDARSTAP